jgi:hypothetical protein
MLSKWLNQLSNQFCVKFFLLLSSVSVITQAGDQAARPANVREAIGSNPGSSSDDPKSISFRFFNFVDRHPVAISVGAAVVVGAGVLVAKERGMRLREGAGPHAVPGLMTVFRSHLTPYLAGPLSGFATRLMMSAPSALAQSEKIKQEAEVVRDQAKDVRQRVEAQAKSLDQASSTVMVLKLQRLGGVADGIILNGTSIDGFAQSLESDTRLTTEKLTDLSGELAAFHRHLEIRRDDQCQFSLMIDGGDNLLAKLSGINETNFMQSQSLSGQIKRARQQLSQDSGLGGKIS